MVDLFVQKAMLDNKNGLGKSIAEMIDAKAEIVHTKLGHLVFPTSMRGFEWEIFMSSNC